MLKRIILILSLSFFAFASVSGSENPPPPKKLKFFNLDLHISVIGDLKNLFESYGHQVESWSISEHTWVFKNERAKVEVVNEKTWRNLDREMCDRFYEHYKDYLSQFDAFIVTNNASFALLYEKFDKPIIIVNSTRYENPFTHKPEKWAWLDAFLKKGVEKNQIFIVSNNKGDRDYLKHFTGIDSEVIPSLCLYTKSHHTGKKKGFIWRFPDQAFKSFTKKQMGAQKKLIQNNNLSHRHSWQELYDYQGVVHFPYQISTMSIFEQYSANVPLFFPSKKFLISLRSTHPQILSQLSFFSAEKAPVQLNNPNNINDGTVLQTWIDSADFYDPENMPYIQYFDSFEHLKKLLTTVDCKKISKQMQIHNEKRKQLALKKWETILEKVVKGS
jgi:hypothetical protein